MGIQIAEIIPKQEITLKQLKGKIVAIDAYNTLYQFLTTIRQADGTPLMDSKGKITSHLSGLFYRNINLLLEGVKPIYVFDGIPPELKHAETDRRKQLKEQAQENYESAKSQGDIQEMRKYSAQFVKVDKQIVEESKELIQAMGIPVVQAKGEGEAEAAFLANSSKAWASASQDYDSIMYGAKRLIRNLTLSRKRKTSSGVYIDVKIELIEFDKVLNHLAVNKDQLICLGILVGTDYNPGGVKGLGQKRALEIVRTYQYPVKIFEYIEKSDRYQLNFDWQAVYKEFKKPDCCIDPQITFEKPDKEKIKQILTEREFSENRIDSGLNKLDDARKAAQQQTLF